MDMAVQATLYVNCIHVIVPESDRDAANDLAAAVGPDYEGSFTDANVSVDGAFPPTHIYINVRLRADEHLAWDAAIADWATHGLSAQPQYWMIRVEDGELLDSNTSAASIGQTWDLLEQNTFAAAGLAWTVFPEE